MIPELKSKSGGNITVSDLRDFLNTLDDSFDNHSIIMSKDAEGNTFTPLYSTNEFYLDQEPKNWEVFVYDAEESYYENGFDSQEDWDEFKETHDKCLVFWPVN